MKVFLTGSSGYLGRRIVELLVQDPDVLEIVGIDVVPPVVIPEKLHFIRHDVTQPFEQFLEGVDAAIHLAFVLNPMQDERLQERINLGGTSKFIQAVQIHRVPTVVGVTSSVAYGAHPDNPERLTEAHPLRGNSDFAYARDKVRQEALFNSLRQEGITVKTVRPVVVMGPNIDNYISRYMLKPVIVAALGYDPEGQFVHEEDVARAVVTLLRKGAGGPYNLAGDGVLTLDTMAAMLGRQVVRLPLFVLRQALKAGWKFRLKSITEAPPGMLSYIIHPWLVENSRLKRETGFEYLHSSESTFRLFAESQR